MTTIQPAADITTYRHPFTAALAARDLDALVAILAPDPVLHSAVTGAPFQGRKALADIYASLFESFEDFQIHDEFQNGDTHVFFWQGRIDGRFVEGADRLRLDGDGKVREVTIVGRPLSGLAGFITGIGYGFARRRRGERVAKVLRAAARPLAPLFASLDAVTRWLIRGKPS